jgi:hypothetical protein
VTWSLEPKANRAQHYVDRKTKNHTLKAIGKVGAQVLIGIVSEPGEPPLKVYLKLDKQPAAGK